MTLNLDCEFGLQCTLNLSVILSRTGLILNIFSVVVKFCPCKQNIIPVLRYWNLNIWFLKKWELKKHSSAKI